MEYRAVTYPHPSPLPRDGRGGSIWTSAETDRSPTLCRVPGERWSAGATADRRSPCTASARRLSRAPPRLRPGTGDGGPDASRAAASSSSVAATVSSRTRLSRSGADVPQTTRQKLFVGDSKSQCDAPSIFVVRTSRGAARASVRPLPNRLQGELSASEHDRRHREPRGGVRAGAGPIHRIEPDPAREARHAVRGQQRRQAARRRPHQHDPRPRHRRQPERAGFDTGREFRHGVAVGPQVQHVRQIGNDGDDTRLGQRSPKVVVTLARPAEAVRDDRDAERRRRRGPVDVDRLVEAGERDRRRLERDRRCRTRGRGRRTGPPREPTQTSRRGPGAQATRRRRPAGRTPWRRAGRAPAHHGRRPAHERKARFGDHASLSFPSRCPRIAPRPPLSESIPCSSSTSASPRIR